MYRARLFAVRFSRSYEWAYLKLEAALIFLDPLFEKIGYSRIERPVALVEGVVKGLLFDCQMCGQCVLSSTGMSCPMNCPKQLRNGPCGGVRPGGFCEVKPSMRCVWVEAWDGASRMRGKDRIKEVMLPVDRRLENSSAWLRTSRSKAKLRRETHEAKQIALSQAASNLKNHGPANVPSSDDKSSKLGQE